MKRVHPKGEATAPRVPALPFVDFMVERGPWGVSTFVGADGHEVASTCLNCRGQYCRQFGPEVGVHGQLAVCPTNAFALTAAHDGVSLDVDRCFGCGLCVMRCPYGSLILGKNGYPELASPADSRFRPATEVELTTFSENLQIRVAPGAGAPEKSLAGLLENVAGTLGPQFYPLVVNLLRTLGLAATARPQGDVNNRADALIYDPTDSIPLEIKSPGETAEVDVKSVQQALENKVIMLSRRKEQYPTRRETTTLSVALKYPPPRSDVWQLIDDIWAAYGVNVGLLTIGDLYKMVWRKQVARQSPNLSRLREFRGAYT
jgi:NAD-dependent dihydropyrimidine dehydrogenase PreA subunit